MIANCFEPLGGATLSQQSGWLKMGDMESAGLLQSNQRLPNKINVVGEVGLEPTKA
jgi:hypothetical protein